MIKRLLFLFLGIIRKTFSKRKFHIKAGYWHRKKYTHFSDIKNEDQWQKEVYEIAAATANMHNYKKILDIGCGSAFKLIKNFSTKYDFIGIEVGDTLRYLQEKYPDYTWLNGELVDYSNLDAEMIICADVIEHVLDPSAFLNRIRQVKNVKKILISTPDRLLARGWYDFGPPKNPAHIREWNGKEFYNYISSLGFEILSHQVTNYSASTQLVICEIKSNTL